MVPASASAASRRTPALARTTLSKELTLRLEALVVVAPRFAGHGALHILPMSKKYRRRPILKVVASGGTAYSLRSATIGSTRDARRAGAAIARSATPTSTRLTNPKVVGSSGRTP